MASVYEITDLACLIDRTTNRQQAGPTGTNVEVNLGNGLSIHPEFYK